MHHNSVTNLIKIVQLQGPKIVDNACCLFENHWLSRYPRPTKVIHDHGPEFEGHNFQFSLGHASIKAVNISPNTPTANSITKATHKNHWLSHSHIDQSEAPKGQSLRRTSLSMKPLALPCTRSAATQYPLLEIIPLAP